MLVLTRRTDESIIISDNITITILGIEGDKVKLGISAPREVAVLRKELWQAIREQEQIASRLAEAGKTDGFDELRKFLAEETTPEEKPQPPEGL
ncbi:MAG: carbon storage regulator CsrA [Chloroflexi bacterium]|nr:carbon storage regulator CsrA [Chloroflexota bacterium]